MLVGHVEWKEKKREVLSVDVNNAKKSPGPKTKNWMAIPWTCMTTLSKE